MYVECLLLKPVKFNLALSLNFARKKDCYAYDDAPKAAIPACFAFTNKLASQLLLSTANKQRLSQAKRLQLWLRLQFG